MLGCMGWASDDLPITIELTKLWNKLGTENGFIYSLDDNVMPEHLSKLLDAINSVRKYLKQKI